MGIYAWLGVFLIIIVIIVILIYFIYPIKGKWGEWEICSKPCNSGERVRTRQCIFGKCKDISQSEECNTRKCVPADYYTATYDKAFLGNNPIVIQNTNIDDCLRRAHAGDNGLPFRSVDLKDNGKMCWLYKDAKNSTPLKSKSGYTYYEYHDI